MIRADLRSRLTRNDAQLALQLIARGSNAGREAGEAALSERGIDALLDDPQLLTGLIESTRGMQASFPLFCYVVVRHALRAAGEDDATIADYVASVLMHFGLRDRAHRIAESDDQRYDTLVGLAGDLEDPDARRNFLVAAHLGNYALWLSGVYPDFIEHRHWRRGGPDLDYFEEMGRRGFRVAADHQLASEQGLAPLFALAADRFAVLRIALNRVSDRFLFPNVHSPDRLMRHVRDDVRWRLMH